MSARLLLGCSREHLEAIEHAAAVAPETNRADYEPPKKKQLGLF